MRRGVRSASRARKVGDVLSEHRPVTSLYYLMYEVPHRVGSYLLPRPVEDLPVHVYRRHLED